MRKGYILLLIGGVIGSIYGLVEVLKRVAIFDLMVWGWIVMVLGVLVVVTVVIVKMGNRSIS